MGNGTYQKPANLKEVGMNQVRLCTLVTFSCSCMLLFFGGQSWGQESIFSDDTKAEQTQAVPVGNAILEGIQLTSEPAGVPDEVLITCYFIFRDKPSSYFYETKNNEKMIVFEFNDVKIGESPISSSKEPPIKSFEIKQDRVDANKDVVGLNPEWHDLVRVYFSMDAIPQISVKDEYSVISFSFKWSQNPEKMILFTKQEKSNKGLYYSIIGGTVVLAGAGTYLILQNRNNEIEAQPLTPIQDEIIHPDPTKPRP